MQFPIFQTTDELLTVILVMVAFSLWVQRFRVFKYVGPALTVILLGLALVNLNIVPGYQDVYGVVITYCVPMSISIYLLNINLKELAKLSGKALVALVCAVFSVCLVPLPSARYSAAHWPKGGKSPACLWEPTPGEAPI